jgi:DNA-binding NarL/FixJ family response regulator
MAGDDPSGGALSWDRAELAARPLGSSAVVYHVDRVIAEAIAGTLRTAGVAPQASTADRVEELLRFRDVPALIVMAATDDGEVADICEALAHRQLAVPLLTCHDTVTAEVVVQDLLDGASGIAALTSSPSAFASVARAVAAGDVMIPSELRMAVLRDLAPAATEYAQARERLARMTPRQRQVLGLMAMGHGHGGVAARLGLSITTARTHADQVRAKLDAASQLQATIEARRTLRLGTAPARPVEVLFEVAGGVAAEAVAGR